MIDKKDIHKISWDYVMILNGKNFHDIRRTLNDDYIKILENFDYYMNVEPEFYGKNLDKYANHVYPVLKLDDVFIRCNHDDNAEDDKNYEKRFSSIQQYKKKVCFVQHKPIYECEMQLQLMPGHKFLQKV